MRNHAYFKHGNLGTFNGLQPPYALQSPRVQYAIIVEPLDMLSFLQESHCLGHDASSSKAITIWSTIPHHPPSNDPDHSG